MAGVVHVQAAIGSADPVDETRWLDDRRRRPALRAGAVGQVCFVLRIRPGTEAEYDRRHAEVWPELTRAIRDAGIRRYTLFRRGTDVFAFADCEGDGREAFRRLAASDPDAAWTRSMAHIIEAETDDAGELLYADRVWELTEE